MDYYSARLLIIILVDDGKPKKTNHYDEPVFVFKAQDYEHAFARAIELGGEQETLYKNAAGQDVRWAFVKVAEITFLGKEIDGVEVSSTMSYITSKELIPFGHEFKPEKQDQLELALG